MLIRPVITLHIVLHIQSSGDVILLKCQPLYTCDKQHSSLNGESVDAMLEAECKLGQAAHLATPV